MAELRRSLGFAPLVALGAAGVIGTSWIYTNGEFFADYGAGGVVFGLVVAAVLTGCIAAAYGELAATFPRAGGEVVYAYAAFNRPTAFLAGWLLIGGYVSSLAFYVTSFGLLLADVVPGLRSIPLLSINGSVVHLPILLLGVAVTCGIFALNYFGVSVGAQLQLVLFVVMLVLGGTLIAVAFTTGSPDNFWPPFAPDGNPAAQTLRFVLPAMTFFSGFGLIAVLAEDARLRPAQLGRVAVLTVVLAAGFYVLVMLAAGWVIPWEQTAGQPKGTIDAFRLAGFPALGWFAYAIAVLGLLTSFVGLFLATSRIALALGRVGLLPESIAKLHPIHGTPVRALGFTVAATLGFGWLGPGAITWFLDTGGVYLGIAWALGVACLYRMPRRYPSLERPYRVRLRWAPALGGLAGLCVIAFALWPGTALSLVWPQEHAILLGWALLGLLLHRLAPARSDEDALRTMLGEHHAALARSAGRGSERAPAEHTDQRAEHE